MLWGKINLNAVSLKGKNPNNTFRISLIHEYETPGGSIAIAFLPSARYTILSSL